MKLGRGPGGRHGAACSSQVVSKTVRSCWGREEEEEEVVEEMPFYARDRRQTTRSSGLAIDSSS